MSDLELAKIEHRIYSIRGVRVILDADLAVLYGVSTKRLNEQAPAQSKTISGRFRVSTDGSRSQFFKVAICDRIGEVAHLEDDDCDLKFTRWPPLPSIGVYRTWCTPSRERAQ